jgi:hypothetical protein
MRFVNGIVFAPLPRGGRDRPVGARPHARRHGPPGRHRLRRSVRRPRALPREARGDLRWGGLYQLNAVRPRALATTRFPTMEPTKSVMTWFVKLCFRIHSPRRRALHFGAGNAGFEAAAAISQVAAHVDLWSPGKISYAWRGCTTLHSVDP